MASSILDLATQISNSAKLISDFMTSNGHPRPSFDANAPEAFPLAPKSILDARQSLLDASQAIRELLLGPAEYLRWFACGVIGIR